MNDLTQFLTVKNLWLHFVADIESTSTRPEITQLLLALALLKKMPKAKPIKIQTMMALPVAGRKDLKVIHINANCLNMVVFLFA